MPPHLPLCRHLWKEPIRRNNHVASPRRNKYARTSNKPSPSSRTAAFHRYRQWCGRHPIRRSPAAQSCAKRLRAACTSGSSNTANSSAPRRRPTLVWRNRSTMNTRFLVASTSLPRKSSAPPVRKTRSKVRRAMRDSPKNPYHEKPADPVRHVQRQRAGTSRKLTFSMLRGGSTSNATPRDDLQPTVVACPRATNARCRGSRHCLIRTTGVHSQGEHSHVPGTTCVSLGVPLSS